MNNKPEDHELLFTGPVERFVWTCSCGAQRDTYATRFDAQLGWRDHIRACVP